MSSLFDIIYEDADLLVVHKPADLVCHPTKGDVYSSLISRARIYLQSKTGAIPCPGETCTQAKTGPKPHLIHRLDRETSGVVLIAKNSATAGELGKIWETRAVHKEYRAIVHGEVADEHGMIDAPLGKDVTSRVAIKDCVRIDGAPAQTEFWVEKRFCKPDVGTDGLFSLLRVRPLSGRKHQIRIHLAHLGHPIVGDKIYGGDPDLYLALVEGRLTEEQRTRLILSQQALHASQLQFSWRGRDYDFSSPPEDAFSQFIP